jgi:MFS family permease
MSDAALSLPKRRTLLQSLPFYYGWVNVVVASLAMTATLPGRTHGLGLITEPLLHDLNIDRVLFARINLIGSLAGAAFCIPIGWLIDRFGVRRVLVVVTAGLGLSVAGMSAAGGPASLLLGLVLVRGFGQSALSVVSMAAIGKWFRRRLGTAMGVFVVLLTFGFIGSVLAMGAAVTPAFWVVVLGSSAFNLVWSGVTLFNESMLAERGLNQEFAVEIMAILTGVGLVANLVCGKLATRARVVKLLGVGLIFLAIGLATFPAISGTAGARVYALAIGLAGGIVTVVFFAAWGHLFGRVELGRIQGAAQLATVLASALGPVLMAESLALTGSYTPMFLALAGVVGLLALAAVLVPTPRNRVDAAMVDAGNPAVNDHRIGPSDAR